MSRIGKKPVDIPEGVTVQVQPDGVVVSGPKGQLTAPVFDDITVKVVDGQVEVSRSGDERETRAKHGLLRSLIQNNVIGVTEGYKKTLKMVGTGYRVQNKGNGISLSVGYSHQVDFPTPQGVEIKVEGNDTIHISGSDKQLVGQVAANIRKVRPPEAYKGKGIRYEDEVVRTKPGKTAVG